jgi:hypothetical protein
MDWFIGRWEIEIPKKNREMGDISSIRWKMGTSVIVLLHFYQYECLTHVHKSGLKQYPFYQYE